MKKKREPNQEDVSDSYDYLGNSCSAWDCTGLIPFAPTERGQLESYEEVYHFTPPSVPTDKESAQ